jgi:hypothetical protein
MYISINQQEIADMSEFKTPADKEPTAEQVGTVVTHALGIENPAHAPTPAEINGLVPGQDVIPTVEQINGKVPAKE